MELIPLRIDKPGIYDIPADAYHADPCIEPSFTRSIGRLLLEASPAHARLAHPRLVAPRRDQEAEADAKEDRDTGTIAHAMFLKGDDVAQVLEFDDFRTKAAKEARDAALAAGRVPLKRKQYDHVMRLVDALETFRARTGAFTQGKPEQTIIWREGRIWCRCMVDWLPDEPTAPLWDLKTTGGFASASVWTRSAFQHGADLQAVFYPRGATEVRDGEYPDGMNFCVVENKPPYGIKVFQMSQAALVGAEEELNDAMMLYDRCLADGAWPTYADGPEVIEPPGYIQRERDWKHRQRGNHPSPGYAIKADAALNRMLTSGNMGG